MSAAMPKEKTSAVSSLSECHFTELKLKDLVGSSAATTTQDTTISAATNRLQQSTPHKRNTCDFGGATADRNKNLTNGNSSPLAAAAAASHNHSCAAASNGTLESQQCNDTSFTADGSCCRLRTQSGGHSVGQGHSNEASSEVNRATPVTPPKKSPKDFIFGKYIGEGSFSIVYLAVDVNTKREYAIKVCEKRHILREHKQEYIRREREVMNIMTNVPGFVNLSCTFQDIRSLYFVMTYAKNGDLLPYINKVGSFDVNCTRHYAAELVLACEEMHRRNVVHRDLKPENILLDEDMHTLIADFGSAKILTVEYRAAATNASSSSVTTGSSNDRPSRANMRRCVDNDADENNEEEEDTTNDTGSDDVDSASRPTSRYNRKRKGSFVGTAQYVSPEVLQNGPISPAADLWALGCVIYQMIAALPPFRGSNDYAIFKEILACDLDFPEGFDTDAEDLVRQLLKVNPEERLGAQDEGGCYDSIRVHPFFKNINFDTVRQQTPPPIYPYLPGDSKDGDSRSQSRIPDNLEPGLDDKQVTRLLGMELGTAERIDLLNDVVVAENEQKTVTDHIFDLTDAAAKQKRLEPCSSKSFQSCKALEFYKSYRSKLICPAAIRLMSTGLEQQKSDKWYVFADNEIILKKGYINKRKGLFARKRMLLLTTGPRLIYIDPVHMIKKGEIPWSPELRVEAKNFKIFFVHTPNRTYYLEDPEGYSLEWVDAVDKMRLLTYRKNSEKQLLNADADT